MSSTLLSVREKNENKNKIEQKPMIEIHGQLGVSK